MTSSDADPEAEMLHPTAATFRLASFLTSAGSPRFSATRKIPVELVAFFDSCLRKLLPYSVRKEKRPSQAGYRPSVVASSQRFTANTELRSKTGTTVLGCSARVEALVGNYDRQ